MLFCQAMGVRAEYTADNIGDWMVDYCREGFSANSLSGRLTSLRRYARARRADFPHENSYEWADITDLRKALVKIDPTSVTRATLVSVLWLRAVAAYLNLRTLDDLANPARCAPWALQLYTRAGMAHCCLLRGVEHRDGLRMGDISIVTPGFAVLQVAERWSTKKQKMKPGRRCVLPMDASMGISSPGHVLLIYLQRVRTGCDAESLLFPSITAAGLIREDTPATDADFIRDFKFYLAAAGMDNEALRHVTNHSFRAGGATDWAIGGMPTDFIQRQGGWASDCYKIYVRPTALHCFTTAVHMCNAATELFVSLGLRARRTGG